MLKVSRSGYYKWLKRQPSVSELRLRKLIELILEAYELTGGIYGYRRMTIYLNHFMGAKVNHKCVYRLMKLLGLQAVIRRKKYQHKPSKPQHVADNILNREFQAEYAPMEVLLTDVTEFKYGEASKAYLSAILDYGAKEIVAYKLSKQNNNALVHDTVTQLNDSLIPTITLIQSMSRVGKCIDNGPMEAFWGTIKEEMYRLKTYDTFESLEADIHRYIEFYNTERVTLSMGLKIPA